MNRGYARLLFLIWVLVVLVSSASFAGQDVEIESYERSRWDIGKMEHIAVVDLTGTNPGIGEETSDDIAEMIRDEKYFRVMDRSETNKKLQEAGVGYHDTPSLEKVRQIADVLDVDGVIFGKIDASSYTATRYRYYYDDDYYYRDGKRHNHRRRREVPYFNQSGSVYMELFFYNHDSDEIIGDCKDRRSFNKDYEYSEQYQMPSDRDRVFNEAKTIIQRYIYRFTPHFITRKRKLADRGNDGTKLAMDGKWDEAAEIWEKQLTSDPDNYTCLFNLGIYYEKNGNTKEALAHYEKAGMMKSDSRDIALIIAQVKNTNLLEKPLEEVGSDDGKGIYKISRMDSLERVFIDGGTEEDIKPGDRLLLARKLPIFDDTITKITGERYFKIGAFVVEKVFDKVSIGAIQDVHKDFQADKDKDMVIKGKVKW